MSDESDRGTINDETCSVVINFKHTKTSKDLDRNLMISRDKPCLNSPGDVYKMFYKPKSILKTQTNSIISENQEIDDDSEKITEKSLEGKENLLKFEPEKVIKHNL